MDRKKIIIILAVIVAILAIPFVINWHSNMDSEIEIIKAKENIEENDIDNHLEKVTGDDESKKITVFISGEVEEQQVVTLPSGSRLNDAIEICGGLKEDADINRVNLALKLEDEGHYIVPKIGEEIPEEKMSQGSTSSSSGKININKAGKSELMTITGVGDKTADKIIDYREKNGDFKSIDDIKRIGGIGDKKFDSMKDEIEV